MARSWFVQPEVDRLDLPEGQYVDVKRRLSAGEQNHMFSMVIKNYVAGEKVELKPEEVVTARLVEYVVGWSLTDPEGRPVPISKAAINNLDPDKLALIVTALDEHETAQRAAREEEAKNLSGVSGSN